MRKLFIVAALALALLGALGLGSVRTTGSAHLMSTHTQVIADGGTPLTLCGGGSSAYC